MFACVWLYACGYLDILRQDCSHKCCDRMCALDFGSHFNVDTISKAGFSRFGKPKWKLSRMSAGDVPNAAPCTAYSAVSLLTIYTST